MEERVKFACRKCGELLTKELKIELLKLRETLDNFGEGNPVLFQIVSKCLTDIAFISIKLI